MQNYVPACIITYPILQHHDPGLDCLKCLRRVYRLVHPVLVECRTLFPIRQRQTEEETLSILSRQTVIDLVLLEHSLTT